jgi:2-hydroxychromene-2-carboxylate isomerase
VAERALQTLPGVEWVPVLARELPGAETFDSYRCAEERDIALSQLERDAAAQGLQGLRWPDPFPFDSLFAMRVATYAKQIGRTVAFALAAYRQAFAGGRSLAEPDNVVIAAAACEMHPAAVMKAAQLRGVGERLQDATARAIALGVRDVPAVWDGERVVGA